MCLMFDDMYLQQCEEYFAVDLVGSNSSDVQRSKVVGRVKPLVYWQWKLRHVTLVKWVKTTAFTWVTHCRSFDKT